VAKAGLTVSMIVRDERDNLAQLLPEVYDRFIQHLNSIYEEAMTAGYTIRLAERDHPNILNTLSYDRVASLFAEAMRPDRTTVEQAARLHADRRDEDNPVLVRDRMDCELRQHLVRDGHRRIAIQR